MFCPKCGNEMRDGERFCEKCGAAIEENFQPNSEKQFNVTEISEKAMAKMKNLKAKISKKTVVIACISLAAVCAVFVGIGLYNAPEARMNREIEKGNVSDAYAIYKDELDGKKLTEKTLSALEKYAYSIFDEYSSDTEKYSSCMADYNELGAFAGIDDDFDDYYIEIGRKCEML